MRIYRRSRSPDRVQELIADDRLYNALRVSRRLIAFEAEDTAGES